MSGLFVEGLQGLRALDVLGLFLALWVASKLIKNVVRKVRTTPLDGPASASFLWGVSGEIVKSSDAGSLYEQWAEKYGSVYRIPTAFGSNRVMLCDPKAVAHFYARETFGYNQSPLTKAFIEKIVGRGVLWSEGESHKRQRKALSPAFSNAAIRNVTSVFYDSVYKLKAAWDSKLEATLENNIVIDVQTWMNHISLDSIGIAGFSHDFGSLEGKYSTVADVFEQFGTVSKPTTYTRLIFLLATIWPILTRLPSPRGNLVIRLNESMRDIALELLANTRQEKAGASKTDDKSIIGLLIKAEDNDSELNMSQDEVMAQMKVLILAGYETTSISLTWALVNLCRRLDVQAKLREELAQFSGRDPTYEQLSSSLPYLDAVVHEVLRLHPPVSESSRVAMEDDVLPLSEPLQLPNGQVVDRIAVTKGQPVSVPIACLNRSAAIWGPDAKEFKPERWLEDGGLPKKAQEMQGTRHLLTFVDGPRTCLGRNFALTEFKAVLGVLVRNFSFEFRDGPETEVEMKRGVLPRPGIKGEDGPKVPLRIRRVD